METRPSQRLFFAIALPGDLKERLLQTQARLRASLHQGGGRVRWSRPDGLHITLAFLGDVAADRLPLLGAIGARVAGATAAFRLAAEGMGFFGRPQPAVLWAGIGREPALFDLQDTLDQALEEAGVPVEDAKGFLPHVTLGRVKHWPRGLRLQDQFGFDAEARFGSFAADTLVLYCTERGEDGSRYSVVGQWPLIPSAAVAPSPAQAGGEKGHALVRRIAPAVPMRRVG